jgi:hypothetical protein
MQRESRDRRRRLLLTIDAVLPLAGFVLLKLVMWLSTWVADRADPMAVTLAFRFAVLWAIGVLGVRLFTDSGEDAQAGVRLRRLRRVYVWLVGVLATMMWGASLVETLLPNVTSSVRVLGSSVALAAIWSVFIFLWLVYRGDGSPTYHMTSYLGQYRTIWTLLSATFLALVLVNVSSYLSVQDRVAGLNARIIDAQATLDRLAVGNDYSGATVYDLNTNAFCLLKLVDGYAIRTLVPQEAPPVGKDHPCDKATTAQELADQVTLKLPIMRYYLRLAESQARVGMSLIDFGPETTSASTSSNDMSEWLAQPRVIVAQTVNSAALARAGLDNADAAFDAYSRSPDDAARALALDRLDRVVLSDVYGNTSELASQASAARNSLAAIDLPTLPVFLWVTIFYAVLLSVPSVLLLLFFIRKRDQRAAQIMDDLSQLDPSQGLLMRVLGLDSPLNSGPGRLKESDAWKEAIAALKARHTAIRRGELPDNDAAVQPIVEELAARAFSNLEYAMALTLLTCLLGLGWYFVFYPETTAGLAMLIAHRADVNLVTTYLTRASPLTYGFVGAYFWVFQMLLRRYLAGDLYPSAFLQAAERVVVVFILSLVFAILSLISPLAGATAVVAFVAGVYPNAGLRQITRYANRMIRGSIFPEKTESALLTNLDGIDIWIEARLVEEKVESIQSLATAEIEMLVLRTNFPTTQIVDWIDQALLYLHAGFQGRWYPNMRMAGVRSASDLLDAAGVLRADVDGTVDPERRPDPDLIKCIAGAAAQGSGPDLTNTLSVMCDALWPDPNVRYVLAYMGYELKEAKVSAAYDRSPEGLLDEKSPPQEIVARH